MSAWNTRTACLLPVVWLTLAAAQAQFHPGVKAGIAISGISVKTSDGSQATYQARVLGKITIWGFPQDIGSNYFNNTL